MNHTLKTLLNAAPKELREAFIDARCELTNSRSLAEYDHEMEAMLMEQRKHTEQVVARTNHQSPHTKRVTHLQTR